VREKFKARVVRETKKCSDRLSICVKREEELKIKRVNAIGELTIKQAKSGLSLEDENELKLLLLGENE